MLSGAKWRLKSHKSDTNSTQKMFGTMRLGVFHCKTRVLRSRETPERSAKSLSSAQLSLWYPFFFVPNVWSSGRVSRLSEIPLSFYYYGRSQGFVRKIELSLSMRSSVELPQYQLSSIVFRSAAIPQYRPFPKDPSCTKNT